MSDASGRSEERAPLSEERRPEPARRSALARMGRHSVAPGRSEERAR